MTSEELRSSCDFIAVENMYKDYIQDDIVLKSVLQSQVELTSFYTSYNDIFPKLFTVAGANLFEKLICEFIKNCFSSDSTMISSFIANQALERRYHVMFDWSANNANKFYNLFGSAFCEHMKALLDANTTMKEKEKSFMRLGRSRNDIVHKGISTFNLGKTAKEVYIDFENSIIFILFVFQNLKMMQLK